MVIFGAGLLPVFGLSVLSHGLSFDYLVTTSRLSRKSASAAVLDTCSGIPDSKARIRQGDWGVTWMINLHKLAW